MATRKILNRKNVTILGVLCLVYIILSYRQFSFKYSVLFESKALDNKASGLLPSNSNKHEVTYNAKNIIAPKEKQDNEIKNYMDNVQKRNTEELEKDHGLYSLSDTHNTHMDGNKHEPFTFPTIIDNPVTPLPLNSANYSTIKPKAWWKGIPQILCHAKHMVLTPSASAERQYLQYLAVNNGVVHHQKELTGSQVLTIMRKIKSRSFSYSFNAIYQMVENQAGFLESSTLLRTAKQQRPYIVSFNITEQYLGSPTTGGASFRIISYSGLVQICGFYDHFNGNYTAYCPLFDTCADIELQLAHIDFNAYRGSAKAHDEVLWRAVVCRLPQHRGQNKEEEEAESCDVDDEGSKAAGQQRVSAEWTMQTLSTHGLWAGNRSHHHFVANSGLRLPISAKFMCDCFRRHRVRLIGASHMRNAYYCMLNTCKREKVMRNVKVTWSTYANVTVKDLRGWRAMDAAGGDGQLPVVYVLQTGSWDIGFTSFYKALEETQPNYFSNITAIHREMKPGRETLVLMGTPSLPNESWHPLRLVGRTNEVSAVYNGRLRAFAAENKIPFLDTMSITYPFYRERYIEHIVPSHHYNNYQCKGLAGMVLIETLWSLVCPDLALQYRDTFTTREQDFWVEGI